MTQVRIPGFIMANAMSTESVAVICRRRRQIQTAGKVRILPVKGLHHSACFLHVCTPEMVREPSQHTSKRVEPNFKLTQSAIRIKALHRTSILRQTPLQTVQHFTDPRKNLMPPRERKVKRTGLRPFWRFRNETPDFPNASEVSGKFGFEMS